MPYRIHNPDPSRRARPPVRSRRPRSGGFFSRKILGLTLGLWLKIAGAGAAAATVVGVGAAAWLAIYVVRVTADLPEIEDLAEYEPPVMTRVHAGDGRLIAEYARESRVFVPIETIPEPIIQAFIAAEDKNFYQHNGIDPVGLVRAQLRNGLNCLRGGCTRQGGSTITQQVAKNFKLTARQTIERKVQDMVLATRIEKAFTKDEILELYLNEIYLGRRAYGVAAASLLYFGKSLDELTLSEIGYLAALPKAPSTLDITRESAKPRAIARRNYVLGRMRVNGFITRAQEDAARTEDLSVAERLSGSTYRAAEYFVEEVRRELFTMFGEDELYDGGLSVRTTLDTRLQVAARGALRRGLEAYDRRAGYRGPVGRIETGSGWADRLIETELPPDIAPWGPAVVLAAEETQVLVGLLDGSVGRIPTPLLYWARRPDASGVLGPRPSRADGVFEPGDVILIQRAAATDWDEMVDAAGEGEEAREAAETARAEFETGDDIYALRQQPSVNGGILAMDPHTGRVLAMVGGYSFRLSQFNRATQARRQPGSAFKPFVYGAALEVGKTPVSLILDAPYVSIQAGDGGAYKPQNYTGRWYGQSTMRLGVEQSRNAMTVRLANDIGLERVSEIGERFGIYNELPPYEAMALGAGETTLWRVASAYAALITGGKAVQPTLIDRIQDRDGRSILVHDQRACAGCVIDDWRGAPEPRLDDDRATVMDPVTAYQIVSMLEGAVARGTARRAVGTIVPQTVGGKTGTTNDFKDAWFVGFSPDLVVAIYIGFDTPRSMGEGESGGRVAAPVFADFMLQALNEAADVPFRIPPGVRLVRVDRKTGELSRPGDPAAILEAFRPGTAPTRFAAAGSSSSRLGDGPARVRTGVRVAGPFEGEERQGARPEPFGVRAETDVGAPTAESGLSWLDQAARAGAPPAAASPSDGEGEIVVGPDGLPLDAAALAAIAAAEAQAEENEDDFRPLY